MILAEGVPVEFGWPAAFAVAAVCAMFAVMFFCMKESFGHDGTTIWFRKPSKLSLVRACPQCQKKNKVVPATGQPVCGACKSKLFPGDLEWVTE